MTRYFVDTSALVKLYHTEPGSQAVAAIFAEPDASYCVSRLALVESVSAFSLKVRTAEIPLAQLSMARKSIWGDVKQRIVLVARIFVRHFGLAEDLLLRHGPAHRLRTLDAIQLAVALDLFGRQQIDALVSSDSVLCQVAALEGLRAINPLSPRP
jgi:uncharacterized protein